MITALSVPLHQEVTTDAGKPVTSRKDDPGRVEYAAAQFEALMIGEMMKSIREAEAEGPMSGEKDQSSSSVLQLADEQFAQALAARGGLGLARIFTHAFPPTGSRSE